MICVYIYAIIYSSASYHHLILYDTLFPYNFPVYPRLPQSDPAGSNSRVGAHHLGPRAVRAAKQLP